MYIFNERHDVHYNGRCSPLFSLGHFFAPAGTAHVARKFFLAICDVPAGSKQMSKLCSPGSDLHVHCKVHYDVHYDVNCDVHFDLHYANHYLP